MAKALHKFIFKRINGRVVPIKIGAKDLRKHKSRRSRKLKKRAKIHKDILDNGKI